VNIHEYQAKQILSRYGVGIPRGAVAYTPEEAQKVAKDLAASGFVVKAQILAGDRGPAGGVKMVSTPADVREAAARMLGTTLTTAQTGASGDTVSRVYVEEACDVSRELYVGVVVDRATARVTLISSREGGTEIEVQVAKHPQTVDRFAIDPEEGLLSADARKVAANLGLEGAAAEAAGPRRQDEL
jgi:succinyl-CoA synthetase beta subunit